MVLVLPSTTHPALSLSFTIFQTLEFAATIDKDGNTCDRAPFALSKTDSIHSSALSLIPLKYFSRAIFLFGNSKLYF